MSRRFPSVVPVVLALAISMAAPLRAQEDSCSDVLKIGLRDTFKKVSFSTLSKEIHDRVCDAAFSSQMSSTNFSAGGTIPLDGFPVPVNGVYNQKAVSDWQSQHCQATDFTYSSSVNEDIASSFLSPFAKDAIDAWRSCRGQAPVGNGVSARISQYDPDSQVFTLHLAWTNTFPDQKQPVIKHLKVANLECDKTLPGDGRKTDTPYSYYQCKRSNSEVRATVSVDTDQGPLPPTILPVKPVSSGCPDSCDACSIINGKTTCLSCTFRAKDSGVTQLALDRGQGQFSFPISCANMPTGRLVSVRASGGVFPAFQATGGAAPCSTGNDWSYTVKLDVDFGDGTFKEGVGIDSPQNLLSCGNTANIFLATNKKISGKGLVQARLHLTNCSVHADKHGNLTIDKEFTFAIVAK